MDLPEKLLPRISSRMGIHRLCFGPYTYKQLQEIIMSRLKGIDAFDKQAVEFASRKVIMIALSVVSECTSFSITVSSSPTYCDDDQVNLCNQVAAISGDARRALEICRRAAEIADYRIKNQVSSAETASAGTYFSKIKNLCLIFRF